MPLPLPNPRCALKHTRAITVEAFARDDGLWGIDAQIANVKTRDAQLASGVRSAGQPLRALLLCVTIDTTMPIVDATAVSNAVPYPGFCDIIGPAPQKLIGLDLLSGFRKGLKERFSDTDGCTHLTELAQVLPAAAIQAFAGEVFPTRDGVSNDMHEQKPFQLDRCHTLRTDGAAVAQYYPHWAVNPAVSTESS